MKTLIYTLTTASLFAFSLNAEQVISVTDHVTEIPLVEGHAPLHIQQWHEDGDLQITGHDKASIIVEITDFDSSKEDRDSAAIRYDEKTGRLRVSLRGDLDESDLSYFVPINSSVELKNSDGDVAISQIEGTIEVSADDGDIVMDQVAGSIEVRTDDGDISATGISGSLVAHSDDGDVELSVESGKGLEMASIASEDGDIDLLLPADFSGQLAASTADGDFSCDFPVLMERYHKAPGINDKNSRSGLFKVAGLIGPDDSSDTRLSLATSDGDITIRKQ